MASAATAAGNSTEESEPNKGRSNKAVTGQGKARKSLGFRPPSGAINKDIVHRAGRSMKAPRSGITPPSVAAPPEGSPAGTNGKQRKPHRFRPGTVALREIRKYQKTADRLIPRKPFLRLIREVVQDVSPNEIKWRASAVDALHEASEYYIVELFMYANLLSVNSKPATITLMQRHMKLARHLLGRADPMNVA